jgi:hypothetical protein
VTIPDMSRRTEENHKSSQSELVISRPRYESGTSQIQSRSANHWTVMISMDTYCSLQYIKNKTLIHMKMEYVREKK